MRQWNRHSDTAERRLVILSFGRSIHGIADEFGGAVPLPDTLFFPSGLSSTNSNLILVIGGAGEYVQGKQGTDEQRQINLVDNLSLTKAGHQFKFGVDYRWLAPFSSPFAYRQFAQFSAARMAASIRSIRLADRVRFSLR